MRPDPTALVSGEGVQLAITPAGVGSRTIAATVDAALQLLALFLLVLLDVSVAGRADDAAMGALVVLELVLLLAGYPIVMEWTTRGRTLGKLWMGLRVVRDDGGPIGFREALVRGLAALVLEKPGLLFPLTTLAGLTTMAASTREKRLGDMMAGTVVINERSAPQLLAPLPPYVPPALQPWVMSLDLHRVDSGLALTLRQFVGRAHAMTPVAQAALGEDLRARLLDVIAPPPPPGTPTPAVLMSVLAERRRRAMPPMQGPQAVRQPMQPAPQMPAPPWQPASPDSNFAPPS